MVEASLRSSVEYAPKRESLKADNRASRLVVAIGCVGNQLEAARALTTKAIMVIENGDSEAAILPAAHAKSLQPNS